MTRSDEQAPEQTSVQSGPPFGPEPGFPAPASRQEAAMAQLAELLRPRQSRMEDLPACPRSEAEGVCNAALVQNLDDGTQCVHYCKTTETDLDGSHTCVCGQTWDEVTSP